MILLLHNLILNIFQSYAMLKKLLSHTGYQKGSRSSLCCNRRAI